MTHPALSVSMQMMADRYLRRCRAAGDLRPMRVLLAEIVQLPLADALASSLERLWAA